MDEDPEEGLLGWGETVFRDEHVFEIDYVPEVFRHRESQLQTLQYALRPAVRGSRPLNVVARGPPGTGKTTAVQKLFGELSGQPGVQTVRVNCQVDSTRYAVFSRVFEEIFDYEPPSSGISFKKLFGQVAERIADDDEVLVVALDDVNYLFYEDEAGDTLYSLLRAHETQPGAKVGVVVVSSDLELDVIEALDGRVQSVFRPEEAYFSAYDRAEITDILRDRVEVGFREGAVAEPVLDAVGGRTDEAGDLRVGIDVLRRAGLHAESRASKTVEMEDVDAVYEDAKHVHLSRTLAALSDNERALVRTVAEQEGDRAGDVYDVFNDRTDLGYTRYTEIVNKLDELGVIDAAYEQRSGRGRSRTLRLTHDSEAVLERL
ncbi:MULTISPECIES: ORC1-type DNA replication protein [Halobacterium]|uniref:ORC1-type DNA replication protein 6 n=5 Tax=Halobacterium salinarum TaxID=2242 RepID=CDC66_HALSA|nr:MULTISPECIES: ORC1-type DNA replication protein [Halobacterium]Q9HN34.1 RecName: Full=ORC1-type DNA replication protein 6 [Halobacterium salinarum NRC-1]AAG20387.1 orc / cell division control protein 6 [Halobacterium salinarum NRC-1]MBB6089687.1 cell division control protein 6 [Halobacterium salinarum]MCF2164437.1 ORC1-type DNA replication protein [Halobacterium salinarum]MCF2167224.1 ORC1-type DNA replication protein [Halobacterium salinarum]MCF2239041.1 ORC1-type DNA replication protein 